MSVLALAIGVAAQGTALRASERRRPIGTGVRRRAVRAGVGGGGETHQPTAVSNAAEQALIVVSPGPLANRPHPTTADDRRVDGLADHVGAAATQVGDVGQPDRIEPPAVDATLHQIRRDRRRRVDLREPQSRYRHDAPPVITSRHPRRRQPA
jgi:hypothetical protein